MFYSHEILKNPEHGVSTIWLVATVGPKSKSAKITRKAIQGVNVQKACETIQQPGAPIALRLQGSLLYGVSRVFSHQCTYVLSDAEKVQTRMRAFYGALSGMGNALDPSAGKSNRNQLILVDDPDFNLDFVLPPLPPLLLEGEDDGAEESQKSRKTSSQLSPLMPDDSLLELCLTPSRQTGLDLCLSARKKGRSPFGTKDWMRSPSAQRNQLQDPLSFGSQSMKPATESPFGLDGSMDEADNVMSDLGFQIDEHGNIVETAISGSPELPLMPGPAGAGPSTLDPPSKPPNTLDEESDVLMNLGEKELPPAEAFLAKQQNQENEQMQIIEEEEVIIAPARSRPRRTVFAPDAETRITRDEFKSWNDNYVANQEEARENAKLTARVTATQAKKYAWDVIFGIGNMSVGMIATHSGYDEHPLAQEYSGKGLEKNLLSIVLGRPVDIDGERRKAKARSASEALSEDEEEIARKTRPRLGELELKRDAEGQHIGRGAENEEDLHMMLDQEQPELGREQPEIPLDIGSDFLPWNRSSVLIPGSDNVKNKTTKPGDYSSPLQHRHSILPDIERFSDHAQPPYGPDGLGPRAGSIDNSFDALIVDDVNIHLDFTETSQQVRDALDQQGQNFIAYVESVAKDRGIPRYDSNDAATHWIAFDSLFVGGDRKKEIAAQAFYNVLGLATKTFIKVEQDGQNGVRPFGEIRVGVKVNMMDKGKGKMTVDKPGYAEHQAEEMGSSPPQSGGVDEIERIKRAYEALVEEEEEEEDIFDASG